MSARPLLLVGALALGACSTFGADGAVETLYVDSATAECVGVAVQQCLLVKRSPEAAWELFYEPIDGFDYEPGFTYVLEVEVETVDDPPADGSSLAYRLLRVLAKTPA